MRCTACGAELILTNVVPDDTATVRGFEHHTFICSACHVTERRVIFTRHGGDDDTQAVPLHAAFDCACRSLHDIGQLNNAVKEVIAKKLLNWPATVSAILKNYANVPSRNWDFFSEGTSGRNGRAIALR